MKAAVYGPLGLVLVLSALAAPGAGPGRVAQPCTPASSASTPAAGAAKSGTPAKPSSFAPRARPHDNVYGAPIQKPILKHRPKPKPHTPAASAP
jgi:hypothetical protein